MNVFNKTVSIINKKILVNSPGYFIIIFNILNNLWGFFCWIFVWIAELHTMNYFFNQKLPFSPRSFFKLVESFIFAVILAVTFAVISLIRFSPPRASISTLNL